LTALGVVFASVFKPCIRSSEPFVGVFDLGGSSAAARRRPNLPVLLSWLLAAVHQQVVKQRQAALESRTGIRIG
jgi:hypothetical protein